MHGLHWKMRKNHRNEGTDIPRTSLIHNEIIKGGPVACYQHPTSPDHHRRDAPMAATKTVSQVPESLQPRHGVLTLFGYGIQVRVDRGHLLIEDGIGADRRDARLARVGH